MKCAIMQPTYLPWAGYFNLIQSVEAFVFLDDVQFEHQSWQTRNFILLEGARHALTVPVEHAPLATPIRDIRISPRSNWRRKHLATLAAAYRRAPHGAAVMELLEPIIGDASIDSLSDLNRRLVVRMCEAGGLAPRFFLSSDLACSGSRSEKLLRICDALGCDEYLSPVGAAGYLSEDGFADNGRIGLQFQSFEPLPYPQRSAGGFVPRLSVVDAAANLGWAAAMLYAARNVCHE